MKKVNITMALIGLIVLFASTILFSACGLFEIKNPDGNDEVLQTETKEDIKSNINKKAMDVISALKNKDMEKLSELVHPENGVRFSPYGYVDVENDLVFAASEVMSLLTDSTIRTWGSYDGTGDPIELTFEDYYQKFIYDVDFANAEQIGYNEVLGHGNSLNNSAEVYKDSVIIEFHFSGFDSQYEGMDWRSLRIVFEKAKDTWYLVGIIHDQWTI